MKKKTTVSEPSTSRKRSRDEDSEPEAGTSIDNSGSLSPEPKNIHPFLLYNEDNGKSCSSIKERQGVSIQPFVLRSQLYSSIKDRTQVDRELESLRRDRVLQIFKLNTGQDDHAVMFMDDYLTQVEHVVKRMEAKARDDLIVFEWFKNHVIHSKLDASIGDQELFSLLSFGGKVKEEHISLLINGGLIICQLIDQNMYWFAIPNVGSVLKGLSQGRKEVLSFLNRRKYKEMMLAPLEKMCLRFSPLDMRFHLRDLIGAGYLKTAQTPSGLIVRVAKD